MSVFQFQHSISSLVAGTVVRVSYGFFDHVALLSDRFCYGDRGILTFSARARGFLEQPFAEFADGRQVLVDGYLGTLPPAVVMQRARMKQGRAYSAVMFNCEHFVRYAHGLPTESPQIRQWAFVGGAVGLLAIAATA